MRKSLILSVAFATCAIFLFSCQKASLLNDGPVTKSAAKASKKSCLPASLKFSAGGFPSQTVFNARYNGSPMQVDAGVFSGGTLGAPLTLNMVRSGQTVSFTRPGSSSETVLVAYLDKKGRVEKILPGSSPDPNFLATSFEYKGNQLSAMHITLNNQVITSNFNYDAHKNVISIIDDAIPGQPSPGSVVYKYDESVKASQQFYLDEPRKFSWNSFSLLQSIGMFPELQPTNLRTYAKMIWGDNYVAYDANIKNHKLDGEGRLSSYDIVSPATGNTVATYTVEWDCANAVPSNEDVDPVSVM